MLLSHNITVSIHHVLQVVVQMAMPHSFLKQPDVAKQKRERWPACERLGGIEEVKFTFILPIVLCVNFYEMCSTETKSNLRILFVVPARN